MKILVAGGAGYIGSRLVPKLIERGYDVSVIDLLIFGNELPKDVHLLKKDIFELCVQDLVSFDCVVFMAGLSNDPMAEFDPAQNFIFNTASPVYLAYLSKKAGVKRYVYASSCSVYGYTEDKLYDEDCPTTVQYPYGISKLQGETGVNQLRDADFSVISLRQGTVCGYSPRMRLDLVVNTMFQTAMFKNEIKVSNPSIWRPILWIEDAVSAFIRAIESGYNVSGIFNVASCNYTLGALADEVKQTLEILSNKNIKVIINNVSDLRNYKVSTERANKILSFTARGTANNIVRDLYSNYDKFSDMDNPKYKNIEVFKKWSDTKKSP